MVDSFNISASKLELILFIHKKIFLVENVIHYVGGKSIMYFT